MSEELNQKISQLLDDDLNSEDALALLQKMQVETALQRKMGRYEAMSHVLKAEAFIPVQVGFAQRISAEIEKEPTFLVARRQSRNRPYWALSALAASVMIVAVLLVQQHRLRPVPAMAVAETEDPAALGQQPLLYVRNVQSEPVVASRMAEYLQAHNSSRYIDGTVNLQPYAQVVSYSQE